MREIKEMEEKPKNREMILGFAGLDLSTLKKWAEEISAGWNGKDDKYTVGGEVFTEDDAHCADDIVEKIDELQVLLAEMSER